MSPAVDRRARQRAYRVRAASGIALYVLLALAPLVLMLLAPLPAGREFLRELSVALAFAGAGILGLQFVLSARLRRLKAPFGIDAVYHFHRRMSYVALGLVLAHPVLLFVMDPALLALLNVFAAPWRARAAVAAVASLGAIVASSVWRQRFKLRYETWRGLHDVLAVAVVVLAVLHMQGIGHYVSAPWKRALWIVYPTLWALAFAWVRVGKPLVKARRPYRVSEVRREGRDTWTLAFEPQGHPGMGFLPGQFAWVTLRRSPFSLEEHPFSFSSAAPAGKSGFEMTVKELGDFTSRIGEVEPGEVAYLDGPYGAFTTDRYDAAGYVLIAGGIGITPVMSVLRTAEERGDDTACTLVFAAKAEEDLVFREEIGRLSDVLPLKVAYVLEEPPEGWTGERGFVTRELLERYVAEPLERDYFLCGPPAMLDAVSAALAEMRVPARRVHYERFALV
ncbi:MAG: ferric reductase-like transmembrane domain-containing protein [Coriobacteriia bacterium]|nr:ferric reductase-like transmembrane domain-containing protein [Coriobacteriia bacterium]